MKCPPEVQKPETGQKTGPQTKWKFLWSNWYVNTNLPALEFFQYDHQKSKNRKPETGQKTGLLSGKNFPTKVAEFNSKIDGQIEFS